MFPKSRRLHLASAREATTFWAVPRMQCSDPLAEARISHRPSAGFVNVAELVAAMMRAIMQVTW
jgi:hypothetical protein